MKVVQFVYVVCNIQSSIVSLSKKKGSGFQPMMVLEVLPKILNSMIVAMMTESENGYIK